MVDIAFTISSQSSHLALPYIKVLQILHIQDEWLGLSFSNLAAWK